MRLSLSVMRPVLLLALAALSFSARAALGLIEMAGDANHGPLTVFYPSSSPSSQISREPFSLEAAVNGTALRGNGRLIVISHGSPASPWVHADLARTLVDAGFIVALPEHYADNYKDDSEPGPPSWKRRPLEISKAIDRMSLDARFAPLLALDKVGMFGMSAGGHTALTLAGGRWSPALLRDHCKAHLADDFQTCAGLSLRLSGGMFDGLKKFIVENVNDGKLNDSTWYTHTDPRIGAIVAGVPFAADFDASSLATPRVALGLVRARDDKWLKAAYHIDPILRSCKSCELIADLEVGGHGALLSPLPPERSALLDELIGDPPGFDRARSVPELNRKIVTFFQKHLAADQAARYSIRENNNGTK